ncbi:hypothetical protein N9324_00125 [Candidatus Pelagibacter sp.]|nr:hypothetical protein [Candidatus Pelagibacter sp.]
MIDRILKKPITIDKIKIACKLPIKSDDNTFVIDRVSQLSSKAEKSLKFSMKLSKYHNKGFTFVPIDSPNHPNLIVVNNPKFYFARTLDWLKNKIGFVEIFKNNISNSSVIHSSAKISKNVIIGDNTIIGAGVVIYDNVSIGKNCIVEANSVIGNPGFGIIREGPVIQKMPQIGGVEIEDFVHIGALTTINRGTLGLTKIGLETKIDDHVHIAHNCNIGKRNIITAGVKLGGSIIIQDNVWLGLGSNLHQKIIINSDVTIGLGANIFFDVDSNATMAGFPSKKIPKNIKKIDINKI